MKNHARLFLLLIPAIVMTACDGNDSNGPVCTLEARAGISVTVEIEGGGTPEDGTLDIVAKDGSFEETQPLTGGEANLAYERAGTYMVDIVDAENNVVLWTDSNVVVTEDECHVNTVQVTAQVDPA